jgi:hypothetical protein
VCKQGIKIKIKEPSARKNGTAPTWPDKSRAKRYLLSSVVCGVMWKSSGKKGEEVNAVITKFERNFNQYWALYRGSLLGH